MGWEFARPQRNVMRFCQTSLPQWLKPIHAKRPGSSAFSSPEAQATASSAIIWQWAGDNPQAASRWAESFPEGQTRQRAYESLINRWSQSDPYAAAKWLGTLPQTESRDAAVGVYSQSIAGSDPHAATQWAETIANGNPQQ